MQGTWLDEFNAETVGEEAYVHTPRKMQMFRREYAAAKNNTPTRFLTSGDVLRDESTDKVRAEFLGHNLRDMRARGLSGFQPWDHSSFHNRVSPAKTTPNPDRFRNLKQPGSIPDRFVSTGYILTDPYATYEPNLTGAQLELNYRPLLAWISGKPGDFTEQSRHFRPGETVEKSLTILNDTRHPRTIRYSWKVDGISKGGNGSVEVAPAGRAEIPIRFPPMRRRKRRRSSPRSSTSETTTGSRTASNSRSSPKNGRNSAPESASGIRKKPQKNSLTRWA